MAWLLTFVSVAAFLSFIVLISFWSCGQNFVFDRGQAVCCAVLLPIFLFIPVGSLPAFIDMEYSFFVIAILSICSVVLQTVFAGSRAVKPVASTALSFTALVLLLCIALNLGFPGTKYSIEMLCNLNFWKYIDGFGKIIAVFVILSLIYIACISIKTQNSVFEQMFVLSCCTIILCLVFPVLNFGCRFGFCYTGFALNFFCFWIAAAALKKLIYKLSGAATR